MAGVLEQACEFCNSTTGTACCIGAAAYIGWTAFKTLEQTPPPPSDKEEKESEKQPGWPRRAASHWRSSALVAIVAVLLFLSLRQIKQKSVGARSYARITGHHTNARCPAELLPPTSPLGAAGDAPAAADDTAPLVQSTLSHPVEGADTSRQPDAALRNLASLQQKCVASGKDIQTLRKTKMTPPALKLAVSALRTLRVLGDSIQQAATPTRSAAARLQELAAAGDVESGESLAEVRRGEGELRACILADLKEARLLAAALPANNQYVQLALQCSPALLAPLEEFAVKDGELSADAGEMFNLGLYVSEVGVSGRQVPFFTERLSEAPWSADSNGNHVPQEIVKAEELLLKGEEASLPTDLEERAAARALRIYQHAKFLALKHHDEAAEWRYKAAAKLAAQHRRLRLASHSLTRLSYFVQLRGRHEEALAWATKALNFASDPLAVFIHATLRRSLNKLQTGEEVKAAEAALVQVDGQLPSKALEEERKDTVEELQLWRKAAEEGGLKVCLALGDVAKVLICVLCQAPFWSA